MDTIFVVDDGSKDRTAEIARECRAMDILRMRIPAFRFSSVTLAN
ncbi:MAG: hypothetical protein ACE5J9_09225 [Methanosarcinales archaeon]